jgi:hypothetical protein
VSPLQDRSDWESQVRAVILRSGEVLAENDPAERVSDLIDECWSRHLHSAETAGRILELLRLGPRKAWESEVDRGMKELVALGVEEAWPDVLDEAWARHQRPAETAREISRLLHDKFDVGYLADALDPWHPGGGAQR